MGKEFLLWFALALTLGLSGAATVPNEYNILSEIDNLSDESSDLVPQIQTSTADTQEEEEEISREKDASEEEDPQNFQEPKVYGMNIGLHFLLERINIQRMREQRVHLESLIKVLVLTHQIEKVGGSVNDCNMLDLKKVAALYPKALREAIRDS